MDEPRFTVRVTASPSRGTKVFTRQHAFEAGDPVSFDEAHPQVTALEYLLGAVGAEVASGLRHLARKRRLDLHEVEVLVHATLHDPKVYLRVIDHRGDPAIARIEVRAYLGSLEDEAAVRRLWDELVEIGPVLGTLKKAVSLDLACQQVP